MLITVITIVLILSILGIDVLLLMPFLGKNRKVRKVSENFQIFLKRESSPGYLLLMCAALSLVLANTPIGTGYLKIWNSDLAGHSLAHWIDDGLMAVFFLLVGLELKHEVLYGSLRSVKSAMLPIMAAVGGMAVPALIYMAITKGSPAQEGFGIPMATDIAFVLAVLSLLGKKIPSQLRTFLLALAVVDDLGAIIIIAIFYTADLNVGFMIAAVLLWLLLFLVGNRVSPKSRKGELCLMFALLAGGALMWFLMMQSGVHTTISGVLLAIAMPTRGGRPDAAASILRNYLHNPVYFIVLPIFVLANTAIPLNDILNGDGLLNIFSFNHVLAIVCGLLIGKPVGILLGSWIALRTKMSVMPDEMNWRYLAGAGLLGGIGFTMSIFITTLSFSDLLMVGSSKIAIILTSLTAALLGALVLSRCGLSEKHVAP